jgi:hypothetical protein
VEKWLAQTSPTLPQRSQRAALHPLPWTVLLSPDLTLAANVCRNRHHVSHLLDVVKMSPFCLTRRNPVPCTIDLNNSAVHAGL